jgi:mannosyltransferase
MNADKDSRAMRRPGADWAWLVAALTLGAALRFWGLTREPVWHDEWWSLQAVGGTWEHLLGQLPTGSAPPLYFVLLKIWLAAFPGPMAARCFSALVSLAPVGLIWLCERSIEAEPRRGRWGTLFVALSPLLTYYGQEVRMYALATAECCAALLFAVRLASVGRGRMADAVGLGLSGCLLCLTQYHGVGFLLSLYIFLAIVLAKDRRLRAEITVLGLSVVIWLPALVLMGGMILRQMHSGVTEWMSPLPIGAAIKSYAIVCYGIFDGHALFKGCVLALLAIAPVWASAQRRDAWPLLVIFALFCIPQTAFFLVSQFIKPMFVYGRHGVIYIPVVCLATGVSISWLLSSPSRRTRALALSLVLLLCAAMLVASALQYGEIGKTAWTGP